MNNKGEKIVCDICEQKGARIRKVTEAFGKGKDMLIIENIPMISCPNCGESYFTADTLHEIERIKLHRKSFAVERPVPVASFEV
jgi:YgiT-type zinc finger domain-containing protein